MWSFISDLTTNNNDAVIAEDIENSQTFQKLKKNLAVIWRRDSLLATYYLNMNSLSS